MRDTFEDQFVAFCLGVMLGGFVIGAAVGAICVYYFVDLRI